MDILILAALGVIAGIICFYKGIATDGKGWLTVLGALLIVAGLSQAG